MNYYILDSCKKNWSAVLHDIDWLHVAVKFSAPPPSQNLKNVSGSRASVGGVTLRHLQKHKVPGTQSKSQIIVYFKKIHVGKTGCYRRQEGITEPWFFSANSSNAAARLYLQVHNNHLIKGQHLPFGRLDSTLCSYVNHCSFQSQLHFTSGQISQLAKRIFLVQVCFWAVFPPGCGVVEYLDLSLLHSKKAVVLSCVPNLVRKVQS